MGANGTGIPICDGTGRVFPSRPIVKCLPSTTSRPIPSCFSYPFPSHMAEFVSSRPPVATLPPIPSSDTFSRPNTSHPVSRILSPVSLASRPTCFPFHYPRTCSRSHDHCGHAAPIVSSHLPPICASHSTSQISHFALLTYV